MDGLYETPGDTRDAYFRDYTRILHSYAYRRLKHKTQVFFNINNDHVCTRMEHVAHVASVSHSIALGLGLNTELTNAIAYAHDLGHAPFGHHGETVLNDLLNEYLESDFKKEIAGENNKKVFWHEKNGLRFVDCIELLPDPQNLHHNLNLTYAVRDGIISHCGEIDENAIKPRKDLIDLNQFQVPGQFAPCTWEGCVVKISDKIAYLGRDIEDAINLGIISNIDLQKLRRIAYVRHNKDEINTTSLMHSMIGDICKNSSPENGICLGENNLNLLNEIKDYNYRVIYRSSLFETYKEYVELVLTSIFKKLYRAYDGRNTISKVKSDYGKSYPKLANGFREWLAKYCVEDVASKCDDESLLDRVGTLENEKIYGDLQDKNIYVQAIVDYISGMTDAYAITIFNELLTF